VSVDAEKIHDSLVRMKDYCERIAFHMHRFGGKTEFLEDWAYQDACVMILAQIGEEYVGKGHAAAGVALEGIASSYYEKNGKRYYYCETTAEGYKVGDKAQGYDSAYVYVV